MSAITFINCPTCGSVVDGLRIEDRDLELGATFSLMSATVLEEPGRYTVDPCGHEVRGYVQNSRGDVKEWR